ncbi:FkbM family methyltransferase [Butyrivibrio sp. YAB3001]|uniref:FkbM family methyltransferase n=1 Tax=Butyrivibrio sp. YAB3001 TaxID=1520812 RepID=UPI0008F672E9|nr:FkbM family methyltransferase [Butyrivibrio sp. YAB3001]SFC74328.1 methyltransferase, FkbM family [Butyrivibrio sp. YAB3001]
MKNIKKIIIKIKDGYLYKRTYTKYAKKVIKMMIKQGDWNNSFLEDIRFMYIKYTIPEIYKNTTDPEIRKCMEYVANNKPEVFCYDDARKSYYDIQDVHYDEAAKMYFGYWEGKKLYFKRSLNSPEMVRNYLSNSKWEQSLESPHRYLTEDFNVENGGVVFDIGGAEGNFSLTVIDKASKIYIFECDEEWIEALKLTFADYSDKIEIVKKYVSDKDSERTITIDTAMKNYNVNSVDMVKMDIEGAEISAIKGAKQSIDSGMIMKWAVCTYHNPKDAEIISNLLSSYKREYSKGYMMHAIWQLHNLKYPYWVKGVLRARL